MIRLDVNVRVNIEATAEEHEDSCCMGPTVKNISTDISSKRILQRQIKNDCQSLKLPRCNLSFVPVVYRRNSLSSVSVCSPGD